MSAPRYTLPTPQYSVSEMREVLETRCFIVGDRDPRLNRGHPGKFMVAMGHGEEELPTANASNGPWCIVGDDLDELVREAFMALQDTEGGA